MKPALTGGNSLVVALGCSLSLLFIPPLQEPRAEESAGAEEAFDHKGKGKAKWKNATKAEKMKWKQMHGFEQPHELHDPHDMIMHKLGTKHCPPGEHFLGNQRRGGCG